MNSINPVAGHNRGMGKSSKPMNDKDRAEELLQILATIALESECLNEHPDWSRFAIDVKLEPGCTRVTARVYNEGDIVGNPALPDEAFDDLIHDFRDASKVDDLPGWVGAVFVVTRSDRAINVTFSY